MINTKDTPAKNDRVSGSLANLQSELRRVACTLFWKAHRMGLLKDNPEILSVFASILDYPIDTSQPDNYKRLVQEIEAGISLPKAEHNSCGKVLYLDELKRIFKLSDLEIDIILLCLWPEIDCRFKMIYAFLQDDITQKLPSIDLIYRFLCADLNDSLKAKQAIISDSALLANQLIQVGDRSPGKMRLASDNNLQLNERILYFLTGVDRIDPEIKAFTCITGEAADFSDVLIDHELKMRLVQFALRSEQSSVVYQFIGADEIGKNTAAEALCRTLQIPMLHVDIKKMLNENIPLKNFVQLVVREGLLRSAALFFNGTDLLLHRDQPEEFNPEIDVLLSLLEHYPNLAILSGEKKLDLRLLYRYKPVVNVDFVLPDFNGRRELWRRNLENTIPIAQDVDFATLANKFRLTTGQIADACLMARNLAQWRDPSGGLITAQDLNTVCRQKSRQHLTSLTHKSPAIYGWDDIILPKDQKEQLIEICNQVKYRHIVYHEWGFGSKLSRGKGLNVLFSGPSGTGKTMAAEIIGNELGIDIYQIDLSTIVSKYIGETEKNLERVFREGTSANAIIFFDEADSLFGKRSEVRDSHDRYANIEVSYLLQEIDDYDGVIILATNLRKNLDEAFTRRMHFSLEFPLPEEAFRLLIWQRIFPESAPLSPDIDLTFLARQFTVTGGNIRNIALASAFLAARDGGTITMEHLIRAVRREYQKMGKLCTENDFVQYFNLIKG
jgi:AAA+ superfamily predicted ATPase